MTPAIRLLEREGVAYEVLRYRHGDDDGGWGMAAAQALGVDPDTVYKTLLVELDNGRHVVALVPVPARLDAKALATAAGARRATMARPEKAEQLTGYVVGGISPLGQKRRLQTWIDRSAAELELIRVSGGRRGLQLLLPRVDLVRLLNARMAPISRR